MSLRDFIRANREDIDRAIVRACPNLGRLNDEERRLWVLNDEGLYRWFASTSGVTA